MRKKVLIALGGNALQRPGSPATAEAQLSVIQETAGYLAGIVSMGYDIVLTHGNGPQVGRIIQQNEYAAGITPPMPFDVCGAMSQGMIGYHLQQCLANALRARGLSNQVATVVTQVLVDPDDPGFQAPSKPVGRFYSQQEVEELQHSHPDQVFREDAGRGWRRVVASPLPLAIAELDAIRCLVQNGFITIAVGGGGIPVVQSEGALQGTAAVIDKDFASEKLAEELDVDAFLVLTGVEQVYLHYNRPDQRALEQISVQEALQYIQEGHFAAGSMLPKIQAALQFASNRPGRKAIITSLEKAVQALEGQTGTTVVESRP